MVAGGLSAVVNKPGEKKVTSVSVPPLKKVKKTEGDGETPRANGNKVKDSVEKSLLTKIGKATGSKKAGKDDDSDDPIA